MHYMYMYVQNKCNSSLSLHLHLYLHPKMFELVCICSIYAIIQSILQYTYMIDVSKAYSFDFFSLD